MKHPFVFSSFGRNLSGPSNRRSVSAALLAALLALAVPGSAQTVVGSDRSVADDGAAKSAPRVFVKSSLALPDLAREIEFVRLVADEFEAQVLVEITSIATPSGEDFTVAFTGRKDFEGLNNILKYLAAADFKPDAVRKSLIHTVKLGLLRYVLRTPVASRIGLAFQDQVKPTAVTDPWNFWVFSLGVDGFLQGEKSYQSQMWFGNLSAQRVTPDWKIRTGLGMNWQKSTFSIEDYDYESTMNSRSFSGMVVRSLGEHWSVGGFLKVESSTFNNLKMTVQVTPAIEFDLFPYSESTQKQLRFLYTVGPKFGWYQEETIYDKMKETLWGQALSATLDLKQAWGTLSATLEGSHYFHDLSKNRVSLNAEVSLRVFKGLNFNIDGGGSRIHDQLALPKGGATLEEVLLQRRQLATTFNYFFSVGLSLSFGSINSNVVNPRFGSGSEGTSIQIGN
jgi:hypothetical protein